MPKKILLVEDEASIALVEARMIEQHGYEVETVHSGEQAVETAAAATEISLVLMDIDLGKGIDGTEAARRILDTRDIPIVFLSAHAEREFVERVKQIPNYGYVLKSSGEFVLIESIEKAFELFAAHKQVEQKEREYREVLENVDSAVLRLDPNGRVTFFSKGAERIFGYTADEIIGQDELDMIVPRRDRFGNDLSAMYWNMIAEPEAYTDHENENIRKDGTRLWMRWKNKRIYDRRGTLLYIQAIGDDITERKRMEESLRRERDRAQTYLAIARVMFVAIDKDERISLINQKGCEILGYDQEEILGKNWFDTFLPEKEREQVRSIFQKLMAGDIEAVEYFENPILTKSGDERIIAWHNTTLEDEEGGVITSLSSGEDITERVRTERELRSALEEKDFLIKELNHRVKNNLTLVASLINLKQSVMEKGVDLTDLFNRIDVIRIFHEKLYETGEATRVDMEEYCTDILDSIITTTAGRHVHKDLRIRVRSLSAQTAVSLGLIINEVAMHEIQHGFSDAAEPRVSIELREDSSAHKYVLVLSTSGSAFESDTEADASSSLGLQLISTLARQVDGEMDLQREPQTILTLRFPIEK